MNKSILLISILMAYVSIANGASTCRTTPNTNKVVVFFDTNNAPKEIATAREAACLRGEQLVVIPADANTALDKSTAARELRGLSEQNLEISSMVISGHDGGGRFSGTRGSIWRSELEEIVAENIPIKNSVKSVYLLGCYTGVKAEMFAWGAVFPNLDVIAGYSGQAPLAGISAGHTYLRDMMVKEQAISQIADGRKLQTYLSSNIRNFSNLSASVGVVNWQCNPDSGERSMDGVMYDRMAKGEKIIRLDGQNDECLLTLPQARNISSVLTSFYDGRVDIPTNTSTGALRQVYTFSRQHEHCLDFWADSDILLPSGDVSLGLLFFNGFKLNIATYLNGKFQNLFQKTSRLITEENMSLPTLSPAIMEKVNQLGQALNGDVRSKYYSCIRRYPYITLASCLSPLNGLIASSSLSPSSVATFSSLSDDFYNLGMQHSEKMRDDAVYRRTHNTFTVEKVRTALLTENISSLDRADVMELSNLLQELKFANQLDPFTNNEIESLEQNFDVLMAELQCLPLNWHEAQRGTLNPSSPTCNLR